MQFAQTEDKFWEARLHWYEHIQQRLEICIGRTMDDQRLTAWTGYQRTSKNPICTTAWCKIMSSGQVTNRKKEEGNATAFLPFHKCGQNKSICSYNLVSNIFCLSLIICQANKTQLML